MPPKLHFNSFLFTNFQENLFSETFGFFGTEHMEL